MMDAVRAALFVLPPAAIALCLVWGMMSLLARINPVLAITSGGAIAILLVCDVIADRVYCNSDEQVWFETSGGEGYWGYRCDSPAEIFTIATQFIGVPFIVAGIAFLSWRIFSKSKKALPDVTKP